MGWGTLSPCMYVVRGVLPLGWEVRNDPSAPLIEMLPLARVRCRLPGLGGWGLTSACCCVEPGPALGGLFDNCPTPPGPFALKLMYCLLFPFF